MANTTINRTVIKRTTAKVNETLADLSSEEALNETVRELPAWLTTLSEPMVLTPVLIVALLVVILLFMARAVMPVGKFVYSNARIHSRSVYQVKDTMMEELASANSLKEFRSLLRETEYGGQLDKAEDHLVSVHKGLEKSYRASVNELIEMSPKISKPLMDGYLRFLEAKVLRIVWRSCYGGKKADENLVYEIGIIDNVLLRRLLEAESVGDLKVIMENTPYTKVFNADYEGLEQFEASLDRFVYESFVSVLKKTKIYDAKLIIDILHRKVEIANILALLKMRVRDMDKEKQVDCLVATGYDYTKAIHAEDIKHFVQTFKAEVYFPVLKKALTKFEETNNMSIFEIMLNQWYKKYVTKDELSHTLGPYPLIAYLLKKDFELRNLFIISKGIDAGFDKDRIMEMVA